MQDSACRKPLFLVFPCRKWGFSGFPPPERSLPGSCPPADTINVVFILLEEVVDLNKRSHETSPVSQCRADRHSP